MRFRSFFSLAVSGLFLTACSTSTHFNNNDLAPEIYQGYWAMKPINDLYRVVKFQPNGVVKIYDYHCNGQDGSYRLNETETMYLRKLRGKQFTLLDSNKKPLARFDILSLTPRSLQARQTFEQEAPLFLQYLNQKGAKPLC